MAERDLEPHWTELAVCARLGAKQWEDADPHDRITTCKTLCPVARECADLGNQQRHKGGMVWGGKHYPENEKRDAARQAARQNQIRTAAARRAEKLARIYESRERGDDWETTRRVYGARFMYLARFLDENAPELVDEPLRRLARLDQASYRQSRREVAA